MLCLQEMFTRLFHEEANDEELAAIVRSIDWGRVHWELTEMSGIVLRHVRVDRGYQLALDDARDHAVCYGIVDEREEVETHWREANSRIGAPAAVSADLLGGGGSGYELLIGFTRSGSLLGMLDRQEVKEMQKHLVWIGRELRK